MDAVDLSAEPLPKKAKVTESALDLSSPEHNLPSIHQEKDINLAKIAFVRVLRESPQTKSIFIEGLYHNETAIIILEKVPFGEATAKEIMETTSGHLKCQFNNDIYGDYTALPKCELNGIKTTIIHPATKKHIEKYSPKSVRMVNETPEIYRQVTLPSIESRGFSTEWISNILNHKEESERIIFEDKDFILIPDMKWGGELNALYVSAIVHRMDIKSLRDLRGEHLPLLTNIRDKGTEAIVEKYGVEASKLRVYIHYQPSYYHFHVHFTALSFDPPGISVERAHLLESVISNIQIDSNYYEKVTLSYTVSEDSAIYLNLNKVDGTEEKPQSS